MSYHFSMESSQPRSRNLLKVYGRLLENSINNFYRQQKWLSKMLLNKS